MKILKAKIFLLLVFLKELLLARHVIQNCNFNGTVTKYVSVGGPQQGVGQIPRCTFTPLCKYINYLTDDLVYLKFFQDHIGPAGYYRNPYNYEKYLEKCNFLPTLNNQNTVLFFFFINKFILMKFFYYF